MPHSDILDDSSNSSIVPKASSRLQWYFKHALMIIGLSTVVFIIAFGICPLLPRILADLLSHGSLIVLMFGMLGITFFTYWKGFEWNVLGAFIGSTFSFFCIFVYIMTNMSELSAKYSPILAKVFPVSQDISKDFWEFMVLSLGYSILLFPMSEILALIGWAMISFVNLFNKK